MHRKPWDVSAIVLTRLALIEREEGGITLTAYTSLNFSIAHGLQVVTVGSW